MRSTGDGFSQTRANPQGCSGGVFEGMDAFRPQNSRRPTGAKPHQRILSRPADTTILIVAESNAYAANWRRAHHEEFHPGIGASIRVLVINPAWQ